MKTMSQLIESARVSSAAAWWLLALQGMAIIVWAFQKRRNALGGPISFSKSLWLVFVIVLWGFVPIALLWSHMIWKVLLTSFALRALIEIPLCLTGKWKTGYGIAHDLIHLVLVIAGVAIGAAPLLWLLITGVTLIAEIYFVSLFKKATAGPESDVFFVPAGEKYRRINTITTVVLVPTFGLFCWVMGRSLA